MRDVVPGRRRFNELPWHHTGSPRVRVRSVSMTSETRRCVVLVGGNMGRGDGVDYRDRFAAEFPDVTFIS